MRQVTLGQLDEILLQLCAGLKPDVLVDVGTRDCGDTFRLKAASPQSRVIAFEANPENYFEYCLTPEVLASGIQVQHMAISNKVGSARVRVPHYASRLEGGTLQQRGTSSLLGKTNTTSFYDYDVPQTTLDLFFGHLIDTQPDTTFLFWIDVEGLALEVVQGMPRVLAKTLALKIEVEDVPHYEGQRLGSDVIETMQEFGLSPALSTDRSVGQYDLLFVRGAATAMLAELRF